MPTIEFSSAAHTGVMAHLYSVRGSGSTMNVELQYHTPLCEQDTSVYTDINIYKGTRPTTRQSLMTAVSADLLVRFEVPRWTATVGPVTQTMVGTTHTLQIISNFTNASASGTATWFAIANYAVSSNTIYGWVTGTVGLPGSGADLIIADTNIVSGQPYKISNLTLTQSSVFTY